MLLSSANHDSAQLTVRLCLSLCPLLCQVKLQSQSSAAGAAVYKGPLDAAKQVGVAHTGQTGWNPAEQLSLHSPAVLEEHLM